MYSCLYKSNCGSKTSDIYPSLIPDATANSHLHDPLLLFLCSSNKNIKNIRFLSGNMKI